VDGLTNSGISSHVRPFGQSPVAFLEDAAPLVEKERYAGGDASWYTESRGSLVHTTPWFKRRKIMSKAKSATKSAVFQELASKTGLSKKEIGGVFDALTSFIHQQLNKKSPGVVTLPGLLKVMRVEKPATPARPGRNPAIPALTTFDLAEVRGFAADLDVRMDRCDNGEGLACANLDGTLRHYAEVCCEFCQQARQWGRAIFVGQVAFDPEVERIWLDKGILLYRRAAELWACGQQKAGDCFVLEGGAALGSALWRLERLLAGWVTPKLAAAPLARQGVALTPAAAEEVRKRIHALPPLPADWQPIDPRQQARFKKLRLKRTS